MLVFRLATLLLFLTNSFGLNVLSTKSISINSAKKITSLEKFEESWDEGEVAWDMESVKDNSNIVHTDKSIKSIKLEKKYNDKKVIVTNREKIWSLVEKLRVHGTISGVLNVAYYNTAVSDNIINDFQNFKINQPTSFINILTYNYNNILDIIMTLFTIVLYNKYKQTRFALFILDCEKLYKNNNYIQEFREFRKVSTTISLTTLVIFSKSVQSAI
jgi:hypothetical protein